MTVKKEKHSCKSFKYLALLMGIMLFSFVFTAGGCSGNEGSENGNEEERASRFNEDEEKEDKEEQEIEPDPIQPVGAIIDNIDRARPQSGLQQASVVYEFLVEGGITRFMAFYDLPFEEDFHIGPVRSLRPYMAKQALEYGGIVAHGGYSSRTADKIQGMDLRHLANSDIFWRDNSRPSPHNMYTSMDRLRQAAGEEEHQREKGTPLEEVNAEYKEHQGNTEREGVVEIEYYHNNRVSYTYDPETEKYLRYINGEPHQDISGEQYTASRVILRNTPHYDVSGTPLVSIDLEGTGQGRLYEKGREYSLTWEKEGNTTSYYFEDGSQVNTGSGTTWIQVVKQ